MTFGSLLVYNQNESFFIKRKDMKNFNPVRGCYDYGPQEAKLREYVRQIILKNYQANGYNLIDTPILENLDFLNSSDGGDNLRLIFKTIKRGDKLNLLKPNLTEADITEEGLRYDLTVPLARFYAGNRDKLPLPFKTIQIGQVFRAERPQKGRNRQFIQCDIDVFGDGSINAELELLKTCLDTYSLLGFEHLTVRINHRKILNSVVLCAGFNEEDIPTVCTTLDKIDEITGTGVALELMSKNFQIENINKLLDIIGDIQNNGLSVVNKYGVDNKILQDILYLIDNLRALTNNKHNIKFDISIVRGQGYYTGTIFEVYTDGFSHAIGGGGRYDKMLEKFSDVACPALGFGMGFEPVVMLIKESGFNVNERKNLALIYDEDNDIKEAFRVKTFLMQQYNVSLFTRPKNMKNFYEKISAVADFVTTVADYEEGKEIKKLEK